VTNAHECQLRGATAPQTDDVSVGVVVGGSSLSPLPNSGDEKEAVCVCVSVVLAVLFDRASLRAWPAHPLLISR